MSCLGKSLDLRLMLHTKKIITALSDEEINGINNLIGSAILDSEVKGGLRWPFGEDSLGSQYAVIDVWHTTAKSYGNSSIRFKLQHADRFDFRSSTGEVAQEASLKMPGIVSQLREQTIDENLVPKMLEDNLRLIWDHFLSDGSSSWPCFAVLCKISAETVRLTSYVLLVKKVDLLYFVLMECIDVDN